jgi:hypothetical protein
MPTDKHLFLIGAPKCGTTSVANWLAGHPRIALVPGKEPGFFRTGTTRFIHNANRPEDYTYPAPHGPMNSLQAYLGLSQAFGPDTWSLDASTDYLSDPGAPGAIADFAGTRRVKLICILRDPVARAFSEYKHTLRDGLEPLTFLESIAAEEARIAAGYQPLFFHIRRSRYYESIARYRALFGEDLLVLSYADLSDTPALARRILDHLGLPPEDLGPVGRLNASDRRPGSDRSVLRAALRKLRRRVTARDAGGVSPRPDQQTPLTPQARARVLDLLRDDIARCVADPSIPTDDWSCTGG